MSSATAFTRSTRISALIAFAALATIYGQETQPNTPPAVIHKVDPEYTQEALAAKYEGTVLLHATVGTDGTASDISVAKGLGLGLDEKAVDCLKQWRFRPAYRDGQPVPVKVTVEINFRLPHS
jgi:TonB family protein